MYEVKQMFLNKIKSPINLHPLALMLNLEILFNMEDHG